MTEPPTFDQSFRDALSELFRWRRDVRSFETTPLADGTVERLVEAACLAPSVGLSEPWRFVLVEDGGRRDQIRELFERTNDAAARDYDESTEAEYRRLKLAGLRDAPVQLAVFVEQDTEQGRGLGRQTMPESAAYSVVAAIQNFWLAAAAEGVGVGWVSILEPTAVNAILDVPADWSLVAYLCVGQPQEQTVTPLLETAGWESRATMTITRR